MPSSKKPSKSSARARAKSRRRVITIGLDLGTKAGYCVLQGTKHLDSGGWNHTARTKRKRNPEMQGARWVKFQRNLTMLIEEYLDYVDDPSDLVIAYEHVNRHIGSIAGHVFGGWLTIMEMVAIKYPGVRWAPYSVSAWKKTMTGSGRADKPKYVKWANKRYRQDLTLKDEDQAAAMGVAYHGAKMRKP